MSLKRMKIVGKDAFAGAWLDRTVYNRKGELIAEGGSTINEELIQKLHDLEEVNIIVDVGEDQDDTALSDADVFVLDSEIRKRVADGIRYIYSGVSSNEAVTVAGEVTDLLCDAVAGAKSIILDMEKLKSYDEYTFMHSVDVSILAAILATSIGMPEQKIHDVVMAGVLHDIGKTKISLEILNKNGRLSKEEFEEMNAHPLLGYRMLENNSSISDDVKLGVLTHHEKINGSGYVLELSDRGIPDIGRILAVADVYDALVTDRPYRKGMPSYKAMSIMRSESGHFDMVYFHHFLSHLILYPAGSYVRLNTGELCRVMKNFEGFPYRPVLKNQKTGTVYDLLHDVNLRAVWVESVPQMQAWS